MIALLALSIQGLLFAVPSPVHAALFEVSNAAELIAAINAANATTTPDIISLAADITLTDGLPVITSRITILGNGHTIQRDTGAETPEFRVLSVYDGNLTLIEARITGGVANGGGGISCREGTLTVIGSVFQNNQATGSSTSRNNGGGISATESTLTVINSVFSNNRSTGDTSVGGGIALLLSTATVINSTFSGNQADVAGGIVNSDSQLTVTRSTFVNNIATGSLGVGGGLGNAGTLTITNSTFSGNQADNEGGAIYNQYTTLTVTNSTFSDNRAGTGGAIFNEEGAMALVTNSILASNSAPTGANCHNDGTYDPASANNLEYGTSGQCPSVVQTGDPLLAPLADNGGPTQTMALDEGSAAINTADPSACSLTDQRYYSRVDTCDIGAYEYQGAALFVSPMLTKTFDPATIAAGAESVLIITLNNPNAVPLTSVYFTDLLPAVVTVVGGESTTCGAGTIDAPVNSAVIHARDLTVPAGGACTVTVRVTSTVLGTHTNTLDTVFTTETSTTALQGVSAILTVTVEPETLLSYDVFDPAISKIGVLLPGGLGLPGETITWQITVVGGGVAASDVVVTDALPPGLRIDTVSTSKGSYSLSGQTVVFTIGSLAPGEGVQLAIQTTVINSPPDAVFVNTATLTGGGVTESATATVSVVTGLPSTGYPAR
ncbi:MAG: DUF11 domain-containing protein [Anaerolineae bacterium]|nr:DUF11 domain-containing protein [Anaerolineae bacterium]